MTAKFIRELHGGVVTEMQNYQTRPEDFFHPHAPSAYAWYDTPGTYTDDSYFATVNARCIIKKGGRISCDDLGDFWIENCDVNRAWYSLTNSYQKLFFTHLPARDVGMGNIEENSSAMCIGPIGIINAGNPAQAALDAYDVVSLMHWGHSRDAAGIIAAATAEAFNPGATVDSVVKAALENIPGGKQSKMYEPMHLAVKLAREAKDSEELTRLYYDKLIIEWSGRGKKVSSDGRHDDSCESYESIPCAIGMFVNAGGDFRKTVVGAANFGRDCDTIACMAGYVAGAFNGIDAVPPQWVEAVLKANPDPNLTELAEKLYETLIRQNEKDLARCNSILSIK
jgi:ADP-ribosylglycohydrolase